MPSGGWGQEDSKIERPSGKPWWQKITFRSRLKIQKLSPLQGPSGGWGQFEFFKIIKIKTILQLRDIFPRDHS
jgi:hypothetical protein